MFPAKFPAKSPALGPVMFAAERIPPEPPREGEYILPTLDLNADFTLISYENRVDQATIAPSLGLLSVTYSSV